MIWHQAVHVYSTGNLPVNTQNQYFDFKFYFYIPSGFLPVNAHALENI